MKVLVTKVPLGHGLAGSANTARLSDELRHRARGGFLAQNSPVRCQSRGSRNGVVPIENDAISPRGAMTKIICRFADPANPCPRATLFLVNQCPTAVTHCSWVCRTMHQ
jgi:hypothetical protein